MSVSDEVELRPDVAMSEIKVKPDISNDTIGVFARLKPSTTPAAEINVISRFGKQKSVQCVSEVAKKTLEFTLDWIFKVLLWHSLFHIHRSCIGWLDAVHNGMHRQDPRSCHSARSKGPTQPSHLTAHLTSDFECVSQPGETQEAVYAQAGVDRVEVCRTGSEHVPYIFVGLRSLLQRHAKPRHTTPHH